MKKVFAAILVAVGLLLLIFLVIQAQYNRLVSLDQKVAESWSQVQNVLQRRADLIPNLVSTVKGYARHEKELFIQVTEARSRLMSAGGVAETSAADRELSSALSRLLVVVENYPQLKANENFLRLQDELAGTENRISVERRNYNLAVRDYNRTVKSIPIVFFIRMLPFDAEKEYFEAAPGAESVPKVEF
ncbi:MAG TPA: LemA family protein [bacterium]|nr:LemA family protein [bacterium]HNS49112.1 LemA family protein [bacterium]